MAEGREHEAVANARHRLELQKQAVGERHPEYATSLNQLALLLIMHGDPEGAEPLLRQSLDIRKDVLGPKHPDYATNLSSLAGLLWARGDLDGAEPLLRQALEIRWEVLGSGHPKAIASLNSLEQLLRAKQDWAGIERLAAHDLSTGPRPAPSAAVAAPAEPPAAAAPSRAEPPPARAASKPVEEKLSSSPTTARKPETPAPAPVAPSRPETPTTSARPAQPAPSAPPASAQPARSSTSPRAAERAPAQPGRAEPPRPAAQERPATPPSPPRAPTGPAAAEASPRVELDGRREQLAAEFARVGKLLEGEAAQWKAGGAPPSQALIDALSACGRDFERLRADVAGLAGSLGTDVKPSSLTSLNDLGAILEKLGAAEGRQQELEGLRSQALAVLDRILSMQSSDGKPLPALQQCQEKARAERRAIAAAPVLDLPEVTHRLAGGADPFNALLTLIEGEGLSDDVWAGSLESVESSFGKALSVAVARSKIVLPEGA